MARQKTLLGSLVLVSWIDSTAEYGWKTLESMMQKTDLCQSAGWIIRDTDEWITVAGSKSPETDGYNGVMTIPRVAIKSMQVLHAKKTGATR